MMCNQIFVRPLLIPFDTKHNDAHRNGIIVKYTRRCKESWVTLLSIHPAGGGTNPPTMLTRVNMFTHFQVKIVFF